MMLDVVQHMRSVGFFFEDFWFVSVHVRAAKGT